MAAQDAGWLALLAEAAPGAVLVALVGLLGWIAISLVDLRSDAKALDARVTALDARVTALETRVEDGFRQTNERLTRLEVRMDDTYARLNDIYKLLLEYRLPTAEQNPPQH